MERSFEQEARPIELAEITEQETVIPRDLTLNEAEDRCTPKSQAAGEQPCRKPSQRIQTARHTSSVTVVSIWRWEVAALTASTVLSVAFFVTLFQYNSRDLPSWPLTLNLNSLTSIYTTITRAMLLVPVAEVISQFKWLWFRDPKPLVDLDKFDRASRGVWGSICLFALSMKPSVAILGATVSIVSLAIGPFAQQAIKNHLCERPVPGLLGTVPVAHFLPRDYFRLAAGTFVLSPETSGMLLNGLLYPAGAADPSSLNFACPNGNCTFSTTKGVTYSSIGLCSHCWDITSTVQEVNNHSFGSPGFGLSNEFMLTSNSGDGPYLAATASGINYPDAATGYETVSDASILLTTLTNCSGLSRDINYNLPGPSNVNVSCQHDFAGLQSLEKGVNILAVNCSFRVCLKNYHGEVINGRLTEEVVSIVTAGHDVLPESDITNTPWAGNYTAVKEPCVVDGSVYDFSNFSAISIRNHTLLKVVHGDGAVMVPEECVYKAPNLWVGALGAQINKLFTGFCSWNLRQGPSLSCREMWWLSTLHNNWNATLETVTQHFDDIAKAVTNRMRDLDGSRIQGDVLRTSICIRIEWQWLILPVVVQLLAIAFFLLGLWQTSQARIPVWKSSSLPLLFYGPTDGAGIRLSQPASIRQLESKACKVKMRCEDNQHSWYGFHVSETEAEPLIDKTEGSTSVEPTPSLHSIQRL